MFQLSCTMNHNGLIASRIAAAWLQRRRVTNRWVKRLTLESASFHGRSIESRVDGVPMGTFEIASFGASDSNLIQLFDTAWPWHEECNGHGGLRTCEVLVGICLNILLQTLPYLVFFRGVVVILCCIFSAAGSSQDALADTGRVAWVRDPESGNQTC